MEIYDGSKFSMRKMPDRPCRGIFFLLLEIHFSFSESPPKATDRKDIHFRERDILFSWAIIWFYYLGSMNASDLNLQVLWVTTRCTLVKAVSQFSSNSLSVCMNIYTGIPFLWKVKTFRSGLKLKRLGAARCIHQVEWATFIIILEECRCTAKKNGAEIMNKACARVFLSGARKGMDIFNSSQIWRVRIAWLIQKYI